MSKTPSTPAYSGLPIAPAGAPRHKRRVCIASFDFVGPVRNGGVGTSFTALGEALANAGHEVTLLFVSGQFCENGTLEHWVAWYKKKGITFVPLPVMCKVPIGAPWFVVQSYQAYLWLLENEFDVVHFSEWKGPGFFTLLAKHQNTAFQRTLLYVQTHGPSLWHKLSNAELVTELADIESDYMERASVKMADIVSSPSHYMLDWMNKQGWELPSKCYALQNVRPATARKPLPGSDGLHQIEELVFFGRLEYRKGLTLFCDALDKLKADPLMAQIKVTFLGKIAEINGQKAPAYIAGRSANWPWQCQVFGDRDQPAAMDYLQGGKRLAVLPSLVDNLPNTVLECLGAQIPFIAGNTGGIPEMIVPEDLEATLFSLRPAALAERLRTAVRDGIRPARNLVDSVGTERAWVDWHETVEIPQSSQSVSASPAEGQPLVSVVIAHFNRREYLSQALDSIQAQDYPNVEVIVVDDCSSQPDAIAYLDSLEPIFRKRGWQILRQPENRYPGAARNRGAQAARGEYIMFMDDDNVAKPHEISTFMGVARVTGADILTCFLDTFEGKTAPATGHKINSRLLFLGDCVAAGVARNWLGDTNALMRREVFLALGGFHEQWGVNHEDFELISKAVLRGYKMEVVPEALVWYRVNPGETSVIRNTPHHGNIMCSIRPYLESVPPALRNLVFLAQGLAEQINENGDTSAKSVTQYTELTIRWKSKLEAGIALAQLNHKEAAMNTMVEAVKSVETSQNPKLIFEALITVAPHLKSLDPKRARFLLLLALKLATEIKHPAGQAQAQALLDGETQKAPVAGGKPKSLSKPATPLRVSIIIPTFNNLKLTRQCLDVLKRNTSADACELVVVDNASTDGTVKFLREREGKGELRLIANPQNLGFARACNQGAAAAKADYVLFLNNDTEVRAGWLEPLVKILDADEKVATVGAKLLYPDRTIQHAGVAMAEVKGRDPLVGFHLFAKEKANIGMANECRVYPAVTAACMLVRKSLFAQAGGFDEGYWNGYEDVDLCLRFQESGYLNVYEPNCVVIHHESQSGPERFAKAQENIQRLHSKWLGKIAPDFVVETDGKVNFSPNSKVRPYIRRALSATVRVAASPADAACKVSIIILAHNQIADTRQCLASVEQHTPVPHELILVDNGSTDGTADFFRKHASTRKNVRVVVNEKNLGFSGGNNQGLALARGENVLLLNNDTVVTKGWLERLLGVFERFPEVGLAGPVSNCVSGPQLISPVRYKRLAELPSFAHEVATANAGQTAEVPRLVGFCLLMRRAVVEKIGGLDERFGSGNFEDDDLCLRAGFAEFKLRIAGDSFVHHTGSQTFKGAKIDFSASMSRNWELFKTKWGMPKNAAIENGYCVPKDPLASALAHIPLPDVNTTHQRSAEGNVWTAIALKQQITQQGPIEEVSSSASKASARSTEPIKLPECALVGHLTASRELLTKKNLRAAWESTISAIGARPFHPEAYLLLAEIALAAADSVSARRCAQFAADIAPDFKPAKKFLKGNLRGNSRPDWLQLPSAISNRESKPTLIRKDSVGSATVPVALAGVPPASSQTVPPMPSGVESNTEKVFGGTPKTAVGTTALPKATESFRPRLTVCLIAKNEEKFLGQCLASVKGLASQIIVVDTGSTDRTVEIAREHGAEIHTFAWSDDFSAARNEALKHATGDWILNLDADEELLSEHRETVSREIQEAVVMAYRLPIIDKGREHEGCSYVPRLFRNAPGLFFVGRVHEQIFSSIEVRRGQWGLENRLGKAVLLHHGYTSEIVVSREKIARNLRLLELAIEELPGEPNLLMNLGLELVRSGKLNDGLQRYGEALKHLAALPPSQVVPELREALLTQYTTHLVKAGRFAEVLELWQTPCAKSADMTASQHFLLGLAFMELKQPAEAVTQMRQCLEKRGRHSLTPAHGEVRKAAPNHCLALALAALKQTAEAEKVFRAALAEEPESRPLRFDFARFWADANQPLEALKILNQLVAEQPAEARVWQLGGQIALSRSEFAEFGRDWTGEAVKHCPHDNTILLQRAESLMLNQEIEQALPLWLKAHSPTSARHLAALVLCETVVGSCKRAFSSSDEPAVSGEFQRWYQQLIKANANSLVYQLNESMGAIARVLPTFGAAWQRAMGSVRKPQAELTASL